MKPQIRTNISTVAPYATMNLYDDCFVAKVTRQIPETLYQILCDQHNLMTIQFCAVPDSFTEWFTISGKHYITVRKSYMWKDGYYPTKPDVSAELLLMHQYVMDIILTHKLNKLNELIEKYR